MHFFTSITTCYLPKARVLAKTLKKYNQNAVMHLVIADNLPNNFIKNEEPFDYIWNAEAFIKTENNKQWFYKHNVVELCTAIKASAAIHILNQTNANEVVYLDPDIAVYSNLDELHDMLNYHSLLLTPHQTESGGNNDESIRFDDLIFLQRGIFNFGFFAVRNNDNGRKFLDWWNYRLMNFCFDDQENGLFVDQKWGDLIPGLFDFVKIIRNPGYNVATWNLTTRKITGNEHSGWFVNEQPLKFFHFSAYDSGGHRRVLSRYADQDSPAWKLSLQYEQMLNNNGQKELVSTPNKYSFYENGIEIKKSERIFFRNQPYLKNIFTNPFDQSCQKWMSKNLLNTDIRKLIISYYLIYIGYKVSFGRTRIKLKNKFKIYQKAISKINNMKQTL